MALFSAASSANLALPFVAASAAFPAAGAGTGGSPVFVVLDGRTDSRSGTGRGGRGTGDRDDIVLLGEFKGASADLQRRRPLPLRLPPEPRDDYSEDVLCFLRERESDGAGRQQKQPHQQQHPPRYGRHSPEYPRRRRNLVDWTCLAAEGLGLSPASIHLGVRLLDLFMDAHLVIEPNQPLICLVSLLMASKMEEKESNVPHISNLNALVNKRYQKTDFESVELVMMSYFQWNLLIPTTEHFIDLLFPYTLTAGEDLLDGRHISPFDLERVRNSFYRFVRHFTDTSLQDEGVLDFLPSVVASSIVFCARQAFGLTPHWTVKLERVTGGHCPSHREMATCSQMLYTEYLQRMNQTTPAPASLKRRADDSDPVILFETPPPSGSKHKILCVEGLTAVPRPITPLR